MNWAPSSIWYNICNILKLKVEKIVLPFDSNNNPNSLRGLRKNLIEKRNWIRCWKTSREISSKILLALLSYLESQNECDSFPIIQKYEYTNKKLWNFERIIEYLLHFNFSVFGLLIYYLIRFPLDFFIYSFIYREWFYKWLFSYI